MNVRPYNTTLEKMKIWANGWIHYNDLIVTEYKVFIPLKTPVVTSLDELEYYGDDIDDYVEILRVGKGLTTADFEVQLYPSNYNNCDFRTCPDHLRLMRHKNEYVVFDLPEEV